MRSRFSRRTLLFGALFAAGAGGAATLGNFLFPRVRTPEPKFRINPVNVPAPGASPYVHGEGKFALVNLLPGEGNYDSRDPAGGGGLLALSRACTHLRCTLPWVESFEFPSPESGDTIEGWFRCACHGSTYTKAGVRVFGPAPRSVDTLGLTVRRDGAIVVDAKKVTEGGLDNPRRAVPYQATGSHAHTKSSSDEYAF